jgi:hypothetical protein
MIDCGSRFAKTVCVRARRARSPEFIAAARRDNELIAAMRDADTKTSDIDDIQRMFDEY